MRSFQRDFLGKAPSWGHLESQEDWVLGTQAWKHDCDQLFGQLWWTTQSVLSLLITCHIRSYNPLTTCRFTSFLYYKSVGPMKKMFGAQSHWKSL